MEMVSLWQELDLTFEEEQEWVGDTNHYLKKKLKAFESLIGLSNYLDDIRGRILDRQPLPSIREIFIEV